MLRLRRLVLGVAALTTVLVAGCGADHHTTVLSPAFVLPGYPARYPEGSPAQAAMQLLRAIQYNDPAAAASFFVPASRATSSKLAAENRGPLGALLLLAGRSPRILNQIRSGRRAILVVAIPVVNQVVLEFEQVGGRWELGPVRFGALALTAPGAARRRTPTR